MSAPTTAGMERIEKMLENKKQWIQKHIDRYAFQMEKYNPLVRIPYDGEWFSVKHAGRGRKGTVRIDENRRLCIIDSQSDDPEHIRDIIRKRLKTLAKSRVPEMVEFWSKKLDIPYSSVSVRNQKTRWGSSSGKGHISINWRVICTPRKVQDYLIVHELVHQRHHNHSQTYWQEIERVFPSAKECDKWLKQHDMIMSLLRD